MVDQVQCVVTGEAGEALGYTPYPGPLGERIAANVSKAGWERWLAHQTMLINEFRLTPFEPKARKFLEDEMEKFIFGEGSSRPEGYVPPEQS
ncbi:MAG: oxidative damage protection protein [Pseudomonadota bacterium]